MDTPKIKVPPLKKKRRTLAELGAESLAAALHWQELARQMEQPTEEETNEGTAAQDPKQM